MPAENTSELLCDAVKKTSETKPTRLLFRGGFRASTWAASVDVWPRAFDIQGRKLVGKTQRRIPRVVNANTPTVQKNQTDETLGAGRRGGGKAIPKLHATCFCCLSRLGWKKEIPSAVWKGRKDLTPGNARC